MCVCVLLCHLTFSTTVHKGSSFSTFLPTLFCPCFFDSSHPNGWLIVILIYISLMITDFGYLFMWLVVICMFFGKTFIQVLWLFVNWVVCCYWILGVLYRFSWSSVCLFFLFVASAFVVILGTSLPNPMLWSILSVLSKRFRFSIHFWVNICI